MSGRVVKLVAVGLRTEGGTQLCLYHVHLTIIVAGWVGGGGREEKEI